jgi:hypothetical protein
VAGAFSFHVVVVVEANGPPCCAIWGRVAAASFYTRRSEELLGGVLDCVRYRVDALLRVEPMKIVPSLPLLGDRLRPSK